MWAGLPSRSSPLIPTTPTPIYAQLDRALRAAIATGRLQPAISCRPCANSPSNLRVNANTVARVYAELERAGGARNAARRRFVRRRVAARTRARPTNTPPASGVRDPRAGRRRPPPDSHSTTCCERSPRIARKEHDRGLYHSRRPRPQTAWNPRGERRRVRDSRPARSRSARCDRHGDRTIPRSSSSLIAGGWC